MDQSIRRRIAADDLSPDEADALDSDLAERAYQEKKDREVAEYFAAKEEQQ